MYENNLFSQVTVYHVLKLFHSGPDANDSVTANLPVYCENYEEIVFQDPSIAMRNMLIKKPIPYMSEEWKHHTDCKSSCEEPSLYALKIFGNK